MNISEARYKANQKWNAANLERVAFDVRKGYKDIIKQQAQKNGESVNAYLLRLVNEDIEKNEDGK